MKTCVKFSVVFAVGFFLLLAAPPGFTNDNDPVPGLKGAIKDQTGIDLLPCPETQAARFLEQNYQTYCGITRPGFIEFRKLWKKALKKHPKLTINGTWEPLPDDFLRVKFWYNVKPGFVLFNEETGFLLIGMDMSFADCNSLRYQSPDYDDGALSLIPGDISHPEPLIRPQLVWPENSRVRGSITFVLQSIISPTGVPTHVCFLDADRPNEEAMAIALSALRQTRYRPGMLDGKPVKVKWVTSISFSR